MKKFLLSLLCLFAVGFFASADTWTYKVADDYTKPSWLTMIQSSDGKGTIAATNNDVVADFEKIDWAYAQTGDATTISKNGSGNKGITMGSASKPFSTVSFSTQAFASKKVTKVTVVIESISKKCNYSVSMTNGDFTESQSKVIYQNNTGSANTAGTATFTPNNTGEELSFTIQQDGSTTNTKGGFSFCSVSIEYEDAVETGKEPAGLVFAQTSMNLYTTDFFILPAITNPNNLPVTYTSSNPDVLAVTDNGADYDPDWRWGFAIKGVGECVLSATTEETDVYDAGKATINIKITGAATTIPQMFEYAPNSKDKVLMKGALTVAAVGQNGNNSYIYVIDDYDNATLLFGSKLSYKKGDRIPGGWEAEYSPYSGLPEWKGSFPEANGSFPELLSYASVDKVTEADLNKVVVVSGIVLDEDTSLNGKNGSINAKFSDGTDIVIRNTFLLDDVKAGTYDVLAAVAIYNGTLQLYPFEYNEAAGEPAFPAEGLTFTSEDGDINSYIDEEEGAQMVVANLETEKDFAVVTVEIPETFNKIYYTSLEDMYMSLNKAPRKANKYTEEWPSVNDLREAGLIGLVEGTQIEVPADGESHAYYVFAGVDERIFYYQVSLTATAKKVVEPVYPAEGLKFTSEEGEIVTAYDEDQEALVATATLATYDDYAVINVEVPETFNKIYYTSIDYMFMSANKAPRKNKFTAEWPSFEDLKGDGGMPHLTEGTQIEVPADGQTHAYYVFAGVDEKIFYYPMMLMATATELEPKFPAEGINFTSIHGPLNSFIIDEQQMVVGELETTDSYAVIDIELPLGFNSAHHWDASYDIDIDDPNDDAPAYAPKKATRFEGWATAEEMDVELTNDVKIQVPNDGKQHNYYVFLGKNGYIHQSPALVQVKVLNQPTGVGEVEAAEEAEYYTLQGVKVSNPENGFYIKVANGKATRVFVK